MTLLAADAAFSWHHLNQWVIDPVPITMMVAAGLWYVLAARRAPAWPTRRVVYFLLGLASTFVAVESVIGVFDEVYFADHMVQHLVLVMISGPLFALAAPLDLARASGPDWVGRALDSRVAGLLTHPLFAFALYFVFIPVTHLTSLYESILTDQVLHNIEHVAFVFVGYLFFRHAFGVEQGRRLHPGLRFLYVMAAVPVDSFTGLALAMNATNPFPVYKHLAPAGATATSILNDIHLGGAIMWIGGDALMLLWCIPIAILWVKDETRRTAELDALLDAQSL